MREEVTARAKMDIAVVQDHMGVHAGPLVEAVPNWAPGELTEMIISISEFHDHIVK
jgi:hypothetical protein